MSQKQRLIVLFDGTWNDPDDRTNVYQLSTLIASTEGATPQRFFYNPGVGTAIGSKFRGGMFGVGLSQNLLQGYDWLARHHEEGDEIWIFGFSRGAYTARSLVGLLRKCGLLKTSTPRLLQQAEALYRDKQAAPDSPACVTFRQTYSKPVRVHFIGVWDTVGALGIPGTMISERGYYSWHDTELSKIVSYAYQAMALDEHREAYDAVMWTSEDGKKKHDNLAVEQRWFIGAHANVGGGYGNDPLAGIPLAWMMQKASDAGLKLHPFQAAVDAHLTTPVDAFKAFGYGLYALFKGLFAKGDGRYYRPFCIHAPSRIAVNVTVDSSVHQKWLAQADYRPPTLVRAGITP